MDASKKQIVTRPTSPRRCASLTDTPARLRTGMAASMRRNAAPTAMVASISTAIGTARPFEDEVVVKADPPTDPPAPGGSLGACSGVTKACSARTRFFFFFFFFGLFAFGFVAFFAPVVAEGSDESARGPDVEPPEPGGGGSSFGGGGGGGGSGPVTVGSVTVSIGGGSVVTGGSVVEGVWVQADSLDTRSVPRRPIAKIAAHAHTRTSRCQVNPKVTALPVEPGHDQCIAVAAPLQRKYLAPATSRVF